MKIDIDRVAIVIFAYLKVEMTQRVVMHWRNLRAVRVPVLYNLTVHVVRDWIVRTRRRRTVHNLLTIIGGRNKNIIRTCHAA